MLVSLIGFWEKKYLLIASTAFFAFFFSISLSLAFCAAFLSIASLTLFIFSSSVFGGLLLARELSGITLDIYIYKDLI